MRRILPFLLAALALSAGFSGWAASRSRPSSLQRDTVIRLTLEGSDCPFADYAEYGVWVPAGRKPLRGVMVLQHGCTMEQFGITKPYDLQYRAFARKWRLAVLETALHGDCRVWQYPESGSAAALMQVLGKVAGETGRPELATVPWLIWGHSGGGYWTLEMLRKYPDRIMAAVCYSAAWDPEWDFPSATARIPVLLRHAGPQDAPFARCMETAEHTFAKLRTMDAPASIVYNHGENHNYSRLRHVMIPFFESALRTRLPLRKGGAMRDILPELAWLGDTLSLQVFPEKGYTGDKSTLCRFPDEAAARAWKEYAQTNDVFDPTPAAAPYDVEVFDHGDSLTVRWKAEADPESGIGCFNVYVNGAFAVRFPDGAAYQTFDLNGDNTRPVLPPPMEVRIPRPAPGRVFIAVETVNGSGLPSEPETIRIKLK